MRIWIVIALSGCAASTSKPMTLKKVILYQNGIGYFERSGQLAGGKLRLELARPELDDVLKTLTVIDRLGGAVATVDVPTVTDQRTVALDVRLGSGRAHDLQVSYAVPTPTWKAAYRVVIDPGHTLLQGWALVNNASQEDWTNVELTLATGAPMSFALDLHTPQYVRRPDATGHLVQPTVLGPIGDEHAGFADRDGDGILDVEDKCPDDESGSADDGCPERGRVIVTDASIQVLERIAFAPNSDTPLDATTLDAVAAVLKQSLDITLLEIQGHAAANEAEPWGLAGRRAAAVRDALVQRGVAAARLEVQPYGATQPLDADAPAKNRRVDFLILKRAGATEETPPAVRVETVQASTRAKTRPAAVAGTVRYVVGEPVSVKRGASAMIAILNKPITGEDVLLFRPDGNAPGSDAHPFRAVRLVNTSGFTLEPGPIAIFAGGTFVGDTLLQRLAASETAWIPYALDGSTTVTVIPDDREHPVRIATIERGTITVENAGIHATRYAIQPGADPTRTIVIRHPKALGYTAKELPPNTIDRGDAYLIPVPIAPGKASTITIEERQPRKRAIALASADVTTLGAYVEDAHLPAELRAKLEQAIALRREIGTREGEQAAVRTRLGDVSARATELRESLKALDRVGNAGELRKKLLASLVETTAESDGLARQLGALSQELAAARGRLADALRGLSFGG